MFLKKLGLVLIAVTIPVLYITSGQLNSSVADLGKILVNLFHPTFELDAIVERVILLIRIPRALTAMICGAGLAACGCALQGVFANPLIGPQIIGVYSGAAFGGALGILISENSFLTLSLAFLFGLIAMILVFVVARVQGYTSRLTLVLAGIVSSSFFLALVSMVKFIADPDDKLPAITYWLMGSFATASYAKIQLVGPLILIALLALIILGYHIDVLNLGDDHAKSLGLNVERNRWSVLGLVTVICAGVVSVAGVVGWVGLVVPHIARNFSKSNHFSLLTVSAFIGAYYMMIIDYLCRGLSSMEIPLGVITALIGAPFFAYLLRRRLES